MSGNLMAILNQLATIKQLDKEKLRTIIEDSLYQSISKKLLLENELEIIADFTTNIVVARFKKFVVEQDRGLGEISIAEAKTIDKNLEIGDDVEVEMHIHEFEPKVIKNARRAIQEKIKQLEEDRIMFDYENQKSKIVSGKVRRVDYNGYVIDLGYADALLPVEEQIENEYYKPGDLIRCYVINIRKRRDDVTIIVSRTHPEFVKRLLKMKFLKFIVVKLKSKKLFVNRVSELKFP